VKSAGLSPLLLLAACASGPPAESAPAAAPAGARTWAVAPIPENPELADCLADALVRAHGVRVVRPGESPGPSRADRTLAVAVLGHDPYDPPRTSLAVDLVRADARSPRGSLDHLVSSAAWGGSITPAAGSPASLKLVLDARDAATRSAIDAYVFPRSGSAAFAADEVRAVQRRWLEFLAHEIVRRLPAE
jgi:hypothetical protein